MQTVFVVCEGQTEETFISRVVAPAFYPMGVSLVAQLIETSAGHKGGGLSYERVERHLRNNLRRPSQPAVTTLIDLYKLNPDFPGFAQANGKPLTQRLQILNTAFQDHIVASVGCRPDRFVSYIQPYEFEALLFSDVEALTSIESGWSSALRQLQAVRAASESPEHINDGPTTKPAARLETILRSPSYRKVLHGPRAAEQITLTKIETECRFFAAWLQQLRKYGTVA